MNTIEAESPVSLPAAEPARGVPSQRFPLGRWTSLSISPFRAPALAMPAVPEVPAMPRQGELALGLVKPVHNDLTESDVVVVCGKASRVVAAAAPFRPSLDDAPPVWSRLKAQLFGAEKL